MEKIKKPKLNILSTKTITECIQNEYFNNLKIEFENNDLELKNVRFDSC